MYAPKSVASAFFARERRSHWFADKSVQFLERHSGSYHAPDEQEYLGYSGFPLPAVFVSFSGMS